MEKYFGKIDSINMRVGINMHRELRMSEKKDDLDIQKLRDEEITIVSNYD